jgi:aminomethyltransferase
MMRARACRSPIHAAHVAAGARMVEFAGWEMPLQYSGIVEEHLAVRARAGLFDVSHMGEAVARGPDALEVLQGLTCNDVAKLAPGRAHYNALMAPSGGFVDDLLVYRLEEDHYLLVLNAANTGKDLTWIREHVAGRRVEVEDVSDAWALLALQGPLAEAILQERTEADLPGLRYYGLTRAAVGGVPCLVSRTGYTGEDGFEIFVPASDAIRVWEGLRQAGGPRGLMPAGLGARDTLRLEARMALHGADIDDTTTVLEADLGWMVKLDKGDFIGRDVLDCQAREGITRKLVGFEMAGRAIARHGHAAQRDGRVIGTVTSGGYAPFLKRSIGLVYLPSGMWDRGTQFEIEIRGRLERATVVPTPFYRRPGRRSG